MSQVEFDRWIEFYRFHPFDDMHRYHRPAALLAARNGVDIQKALDYLHPPRMPDGIDHVGMSVMRALGVKPPE